MSRKIEQYVRSCNACFRNKPLLHQQYGELKRIHAPIQPWGLINMDFIVKLPETNVYMRPYKADTVLTVACKTTRLAHFVLLGREDWDAECWARHFFEATYAELGVPGSTITDRGSIFMATFWKTLFAVMGTTKLVATTAYNLRSNGAAEYANKQFEIALRHVVNASQIDWADHIPHLQLAYNNSVNSATGYSPNELLFGFKPNTALQVIIPPDTTSPHTNREHAAASTQMAHLARIRDEAQDALRYSQFTVAKYFDRKHAPLPKYAIGDKVFINIVKKNAAGYHIPGVNAQKAFPE